VNIERAAQLSHAIADKLTDELLPLVYDEEGGWDDDDGMPLHAGVTEEDAARISSAEMHLGLVTVEPGTTYVVIEVGDPEPPSEKEWIDPETGKRTGYIPSKLMTDGLAKARKNLLDVEDVPHALRRQIDETLDLIHEALVALDYTPESPLLALAAEDG